MAAKKGMINLDENEVTTRYLADKYGIGISIVSDAVDRIANMPKPIKLSGKKRIWDRKEIEIWEQSCNVADAIRVARNVNQSVNQHYGHSKKTDVMTLSYFATWFDIDLSRLRKSRDNHAHIFPKKSSTQRGVAYYKINDLMDYVLSAGGKTKFNALEKQSRPNRKESVCDRSEQGPKTIYGKWSGWYKKPSETLLIAHRALAMRHSV